MKELILTLILAANIYPTSGKVVKLDALEDTVTFETSSGILYEFYGVEDWFIGDYVAAIMYDNGTPRTVLDDEILSVRYTGFDGYGEYDGGNAHD